MKAIRNKLQEFWEDITGTSNRWRHPKGHNSVYELQQTRIKAHQTIYENTGWRRHIAIIQTQRQQQALREFHEASAKEQRIRQKWEQAFFS